MDLAVSPLDAIRRKFAEKVGIALCEGAPMRRDVDVRADLVFVDGHYEQSLSSPPKGLICLPLDQAMKTYGVILQNRFAKELKEEKEEFALLNGALQRGLFIYVPPNLQVKPLDIVSILSSSEWMAPRLQIFLGKGSSLELHEMQKGSGRASVLIDVVCEENASFRLLDDPEIDEKTELHRYLRATLKRSARLFSQTKSFGASVLCHHFRIQLAEENAEVELKGLCVLSQERQAQTQVLIEHMAPHCRSRQLFKNVLKDQSRSSFEGKIFVHPIAQKTEAYQLNQNLLLSRDAFAKSLPNLEIFADDVKASHGATLSQLDEEEVFYLRSRGMSKKEAETLLLDGFCLL